MLAPRAGRLAGCTRITGKSVTDVCQLGLTKSYQVNQLFTKLTVRENLTVAVLADLRGKFRLDMFRDPQSIPGLAEQVEQTLQLVRLAGRPDTNVIALLVVELAVGLLALILSTARDRRPASPSTMRLFGSRTDRSGWTARVNGSAIATPPTTVGAR